MHDKKNQDIEVGVESSYVEEQSEPDASRYVFAYTVSIHNKGSLGAKLLTRHWIITDSTGKVQEVRGEGVVGEQPDLAPGESYQYTSGAMIETSVGTMGGSYQMIDEHGVPFDAEIPEFVLSVPRALH